MNRITMSLVLTVVFSVAVCLALANEGDTTAALPVVPCVVLTGADSHLAECQYHRITCMDDWSKLWQKHKGQANEREYDLYYDRLGLPVVDFERYMVIAIFQGSGWNSAGLKAIAISEQQDRIVFRFKDKSYQPAGQYGGGQRVTVYGFFVLPRSPKSVVLEEAVQQYLGTPAEWKVRITFPRLEPKKRSAGQTGRTRRQSST